MSTYYDFTVALLDKKTNKLEFFPGVTYEDGDVVRPRSIHYRSSSFMPRDYFYNYMHPVSEDMLTEELRAAFTVEGWNGQDHLLESIHWISYDEFMKCNSNYIKTGYFLVEDVKAFLQGADTEELFYDNLPAAVYADMCARKISAREVEDSEGCKHVQRGWEDYMYFAYPDLDGEAYLTHTLKVLLNSYHDWTYSRDFKDKTLVLLGSTE